MPLIIVTGFPSSGKTTRTGEIKQFFETDLHKNVFVVAEEDILPQFSTNKNALSQDSRKQKEVRAFLKCNVIRLLGQDIVILDASNNIKGFRYELYCASKCHKTTYCVVKCDISVEKAWQVNKTRENGYSREAFDSLISLYEPPVNTNRWDSPLITVQLDDKIPSESIKNVLFDRVAPSPNVSTLNAPSCSSTYLSDLDKVTKNVIQTILSLRVDGSNYRNVILPAWEVEITVMDETVNTRHLVNLKRQFISLYKLNPVAHSEKEVAQLFVKFINSSMSQPKE